jgi:hypothetical protein
MSRTNKRWLLVMAVMALAAACGGQPGPQAEDDSSGGGLRWVELDPDAISLEGLDLGDDDAETETEPADDEPVAVSRAAAEAALPFTLALPAWAPAGYELQDEVELIGPDASTGAATVLLTWRHAENADIVLSVSNGAGGGLGQAGPGESTEVTVKGQPARLLHSQGLGAERLSLQWSAQGLDYGLSTTGSAVSAADLIQMAEAVP